MSFFPAKDPILGDAASTDAIELAIVPRTVDLGGLTVRRALPSARRRMVGPFIFFDHFGPAEFRSGAGLDVRPHPHIGLATVSYLFDGEIVHRDSLGTLATIKPGDVNWMKAGRGIAHSERTDQAHRAGGEHLHGLQCWNALPAAQEESAPDFIHHGVDALPVVAGEGKTVRLVAGAMYGAKAPLETTWDTLFADATLKAGARLPVDADYEERAIYVVSGDIEIAGDRFGPGQLLVLRTSGGTSCPRARTASRPPRRTGRPAGSRRCRATASSSRCRRAEARAAPAATTAALPARRKLPIMRANGLGCRAVRG
jgi:redox-sensitive bicupin YhaK (pirin superfamily)